MAGVTDKPFRQLCRRMGAGLAVSEMTIADPRLWGTRKSRRRMDHADEPGPVSVQIAGYDPQMLADAARHNVDQGAEIIDINMGCPAKKVCNVASGSALLRDEPLVGRILDAVVRAVPVPVTLKIRTGYARGERNAVSIARVAESSGIAALAVHGRTREDFFSGEAEYDSIAAVKSAVGIPVIVNGDIATPVKARQVLERTRCDALMIGRAAQGRPWIFREIAHYLATGKPAARAVRDRGPGHPAGARRGAALLLRRGHGCAHRPQASRLVQPGSPGKCGLPRRRQSGGDCRGAGSPGTGLFRLPPRAAARSGLARTLSWPFDQPCSPVTSLAARRSSDRRAPRG